MAVRTTNYLYDINVDPMEALPPHGYTWAAKVLKITKVIDGTEMPLDGLHEKHGATAGEALNAALDEAMDAIDDENEA